MLDRYKTTFEKLKHEKRLALCPFAVLGDPNEKESLARIKKYIAHADMLELGIPFSDPIADGPVIQAASMRALEAGMTPQRAMNLIKKIRAIAEQKSKHNLPIGILTYANIVFRYGIQRFYGDLKTAGADSVLIADVPLEEIAPFASAAKSTKLAQIFLASDYTTPARLKQIARIGGSNNRGYLYVVSTLGVTGMRGKVAKSTLTLLNRLKKQTKLPLVVGFGISKPAHLASLKKLDTVVSGAIVGSALVKTKTSDLQTALAALQRAC